MASATQSGVLNEREYEALVKALSSTAKGRAFLAEHVERARPDETLKLLGAVQQIESSLSSLREQLVPDRIADEIARIAAELQRLESDAGLRAQAIGDLFRLAEDLGGTKGKP